MEYLEPAVRAAGAAQNSPPACSRFPMDSPSDDLIRRVLGAGRFPPSAGNNQPWKFTVATDREFIRGRKRLVMQSGVACMPCLRMTAK
jgi:nitroreductase